MIPASDLTIVMVNGFFYPLEVLRDDPLANRLIEGLAALGTVVLYDRRGIGLSDQIVDWDTHVLDQWAEDLTAVIEARANVDVDDGGERLMPQAHVVAVCELGLSAQRAATRWVRPAHPD